MALIKEKGKKWFSKESQIKRNEEYGRKAQENAAEIFDPSTKISFKDFFFKVLTGSAQGILIGVLPGAVMSNVLKYTGLINLSFGKDLSAIFSLFQVFIPVIIGVAVAMQFKMKSLDVGSVALATGVSAGSVKWLATGTNPITGKAAAPLFIAGGAGDVINAIIVAALAVVAVILVGRFLNGFGSMSIIFTPIVIGGLVGLLGLTIAPYVGKITAAIGQFVAELTSLQPLPMSILIAMAFSILIVTPISTVGIALAISLAGLGSGAAAMGVAATTIVLIINSWRVNRPGVTIAIALGAMKGMMPSVFKKPITMLPFLLSSAIAGAFVSFFNIQGTPQSAGFGYIGIVGPIQSMTLDAASKAAGMTHAINGLQALIAWVVVPIVAAFIAQFIFSNLLKWYQPSDFKQDI